MYQNGRIVQSGLEKIIINIWMDPLTELLVDIEDFIHSYEAVHLERIWDEKLGIQIS